MAADPDARTAMTDLLLACLHHLLVFTLVALPAVELALLRGPVGAPRLAQLGRADAVYGIVALLVLAVGFGRVFHGAKDAGFYMLNPVFWAKLAFFALAGLASVVPTLRLLRWRTAARRDPGFVVAEPLLASTRRWLVAELALIVPIPLLAAAMARGVGLS
jgi:putative membrane protein